MTKGTDALRTARKQLERHTRDEKFLGNAHCILKYFSPKNYAEVDDARAKHGAARSGRGIENKGTALVRMVTAANGTIRRPVEQMINSLVEPSIG
jgi:hypothetical protein